MSKTLIEALDDGELLPIIYSPDTFKSNLHGALDHFIADQTGLHPAYRKWFSHTPRSIELFYKDNVAKTVPNWNLVSSLFMQGPVLITLWQGEQPFQRFDAIKGRSHPNIAHEQTIRSGFWCDNSVCNLIHSSDDPNEAREELTIVGLMDDLASEQASRKMPLFSPAVLHGLDMQHSGIISFYRVLIRYLKTFKFSAYSPIDLSDPRGEVVYQQLKTELFQMTEGDLVMQDLVVRYFAGDHTLTETLDNLIPLFPWEKYIIDCGAATNYKWEL